MKELFNYIKRKTMGSESSEKGERSPSPLRKYLMKHGFPHLKDIQLTTVGVEHHPRNIDTVMDSLRDVDVLVLESGFDPFFQGVMRNLRGMDVTFVTAEPSPFSSEGLEVDLTRSEAMNVCQAMLDIGQRGKSRRHFEKVMKKMAASLKKRDVYVAKHIGQAIAEGCEFDNDIKMKETLRIKVLYGSAHTYLSVLLRQQEPTAQREVVGGAKVFDHLDEVLRRIIFRRKVTSHDWDNAFITQLVDYGGVLPRTDDGIGTDTPVLRTFVEQCTESDAEKIWSAFKQGESALGKTTQAMAHEKGFVFSEEAEPIKGE